MRTPYTWLKNTAKQLGVNIPELRVLAAQNDPFYAGAPADVEKAEWFARMLKEQGYTTGFHTRRIHYRLSSLGTATLPDGTPYENTDQCWAYIQNAAKFARHLGLVSPEAFVDRRNPPAEVYRYADESKEVGWEYDLPEWSVPEIEAEIMPGLNGPSLYPWGYEYRHDLQPYHVELWCEKTTMNSELLPLCQLYGVNLVTGAGNLSITAVSELLQRAASYGRPCRILYISDFDPAGAGMPVSVARQIEFRVFKDYPAADIKLDRSVVTLEQIAEYSLPRTPIKEDDPRRDNFEAALGEGAVELDALEAIHPGALAAILERRILDYFDTGLPRAVDDAHMQAYRRLREAEDELAETDAGQALAELRDEVEAITAPYQERLRELSASLEADLEERGIRERLESVRHGIESEIDSLEPDLPELPEGVPADGEAENAAWLYDSARDYFEQLEFYKAHKRGEEG